MSQPLNIIFAGTPDFAAKHLAALIGSQHNIVAVYCPPDKPAGRGKKLTACATKALALSHNLPVEQPQNFKTEESQVQLAKYKADIMVVVAYGLLLPTVILNTPKLGCINVHGSLLPLWRGAAPIQRSLEAGDQETGVTIMQMDKGLDTGEMILKASCNITQEDTSASLYEKLAQLGPTALLDALSLMAQNQHSPIKQDDSISTYATKLTKEEAELDWSMPAAQLHRKIRAYIPWPVAQYTYVENETSAPQRIRIWQASVVDIDHDKAPGTIINVDKQGVTVATSTNAIKLEILQIPGKKSLPFADILNARSAWFIVGTHINGKLEN